MEVDSDFILLICALYLFLDVLSASGMADEELDGLLAKIHEDIVLRKSMRP